MRKITENDMRTVYAKLPLTIRAYTVLKDDFYTIVINENLTHDIQLKAYRHELSHIYNGDFDRDEPVDWIEVRTHERST